MPISFFSFSDKGRPTRIQQLLSCSVVLLLGLTACTGSQTRRDEAPSETDEQSAGVETDWNGHERLADSVVPHSYELDLTIDPSESTFQGRATVGVSVQEKTDRVRMHAEKLEFSTVEANYTEIDERGSGVTSNDHVIEGRAHPVENGGLVVEFEEPLVPGKVGLTFEYKGPIGEVPEGLYRVNEGGDWYAFTQFQPLEAREVYPSFDEPRFKTPFETTLRVPKGTTAASNAPVVDKRETDDGEMVAWEFAETRPLPTYLVAFAIGPFDIVEAPKEALGDIPLRVLAPKGKGDLADYALENTPPIVRYQQEYFDTPFPYQKLDLVAVPNFGASAMENVGLVTYRESLLLLDPADATAGDRFYLQGLMAHEYAHMWFGNLVTPDWWDDLWLNEAFATWMGMRTVEEVAPQFEAELGTVARMLGVMHEDSLEQARAIRQPIEHGGDVYNAFDGITYTKGRAVLGMIEQWLGREVFRESVRQHISEHADSSATTEDLLAALTEASDAPVTEVSAQFLDQPGVPMVTVDYDREACSESGKATLTPTQTRYEPAGSDVETGEPWKIPMCLGLQGADETECVLFDGTGESPREETVTLETETCPERIHPNTDEKGYYHWRYASTSRYGELLENLGSMNLRERIGLLGHMRALVRGDALPVKRYLDVLAEMAKDETHRYIVEHVVETLRNYRDLVYDGEPSEAYIDFAASLLQPHVDRIGYEPSDDESESAKLLRSTVMTAAANLAGNEEIVEQARRDVATFFEKPSSAGPTVKFALDIAARHGDEKLWNKIRENLDNAPSPSLRSQMLGALGRFEQPELAEKSLDLFLSDAIRAQNLWHVLGPVAGDPSLHSLAWEWVTDNYDAIVEKVGQAHAGRLPAVGKGFCSKDQKQKLEAFFSKEEHQTVSTPRNLGQTLESIDHCIAYRSLVAESVREFAGQVVR